MNNRKGFPSRSTVKRGLIPTDSAMTQALGENSTALTTSCMDMIEDIDLGHCGMNVDNRLEPIMYQVKISLKLTIRLNQGVKIMDNEQFVSDRQ